MFGGHLLFNVQSALQFGSSENNNKKKTRKNMGQE